MVLPSRTLSKSTEPALVDLGARQRSPGDDLVFDLADDLGVPLDRLAGRAFRHPVRTSVASVGDVFEVGHELRQVFEAAPESVDLIQRLLDPDGLAHTDASSATQCDASIVAVSGRRDAER